MSSNTITKLLKAQSPFFSIAALQAVFNLTRESARTKAARLTKSGILVRVQRDLYTLANRKYSLFSLANALYQPSVISLETALNYWGLVVQVPQTIFSIGLKSYQCVNENTQFIYRKVQAELFRFGQTKVKDFFIVEPEKALLDTLYMKSKGLAELLAEDVDLSRFDPELLAYYRRFYPNAVKKLLVAFQKQEYAAR
jgi:predicted transcriptional regulator of viral defense system